MERRPLLSSVRQAASDNTSNNGRDCFCEESSDESSCSSSYYTDSDSSVPEWEASITTKGQLLYIDCDSTVQRKPNIQEPETQEFSKKTSVRKSTRSKFLKILHRRDSKRRSKRVNKTPDTSISVQDTTRVKFQDHDEGEIHEVVLKLNKHENRQLGRRGTLIESLLGISVSTLLDGSRVMIAGFIPDSEAAKLSVIKIGDWLKSINNIDITLQNLNIVLEHVLLKSEVILKLQRVAGVDVTKNSPSNKSQFVQQILSETTDDLLNNYLGGCNVGVLYVNPDELNENGLDCENIPYCFPMPCESNLLFNTKGVLITLNHLLCNITQTTPSITSAIVDHQLIHIAYEKFGTKILFLMLPDKYISNIETRTILKSIVCLFKFIFPSIDECFEIPQYKEQLNKLFSDLFRKLLCDQQFPNTSVCDDRLSQSKWRFEKLLPVVNYLTLHEEAQIHIEDSLSELEASDYREWNEEPLDCQRLFTILGSALFHSGYLLASHLVSEDLVDIYLFCEYNGLMYLSETEPIRSLVLWREVYPFSCNRDSDSENSLFVAPNGKRYLLIVGKGKDLLVVLMEAGGCTEPPEENMSPDPFYVEEAQATLEHLHDLGIPEIAEHFIQNPSWQVVTPEIPLKRRSDFLGSIPFTKTTSHSVHKDVTTLTKKKLEVTSILKHRSPDRTRYSTSSFSIHDDSENISEDSLSQSSYSETSEEPVLGRRAIREKKNLESDDDSDIEECHNSSNDLSELKQSLLAETAEVKSAHLSAGVENVLFYYVTLDISKGLLLCPPNFPVTSGTVETVLINFRKCAHQIHCTFENTLRFKNMLVEDLSKLVINKSLVAIKEQGMLFECGYNTEDTVKKYGKLNFWVIGRLFYTPHPREVYICYQDTVPQNIVEIAFKLGVTSG